MSFAMVVVVAIVVIIILALIYYYMYYRNQKPANFFSSMVYTSGGIGNDMVANVPMMDPTDVSLYLGENFTLSYYVNINNLGGGTPNQYVPLIWIVGVGALVVDLVSGNVYIVITSAPVNPSNTAPSVNTILLSGTNAGLFVNKWNQITMTASGRTVCVYLNGNMVGNCITLTNVTLASPTGVYFLQGQGPPSTVTSVQAWAKILSSSVIASNYTNTSDSSGTPISYQTGIVTLSDLGNSLIDLFCQTGLCPSSSSDNTTFGPFTKINYEYS
jgi:hypothetical protein